MLLSCCFRDPQLELREKGESGEQERQEGQEGRREEEGQGEQGGQGRYRRKEVKQGTLYFQRQSTIYSGKISTEKTF